MGDVRHGARDQRRMPGDHVGALGLRVARERADLDLAVLQRDLIQPTDAIDVDQHGGRRQAHVERGDQALAAGEQAGVLVGGEHRHRVVE